MLGLVRLVEVLFTVGAIVCLASVIPVTAFRLFEVLFEQSTAEEEPKPLQ